LLNKEIILRNFPGTLWTTEGHGERLLTTEGTESTEVEDGGEGRTFTTEGTEGTEVEDGGEREDFYRGGHGGHGG
jgi:hypothetical protein